jgi:hypothetical protein
MRRTLIVSALLLALPAPAVRAQTQPPTKKGAFALVIPQVTGKNGYEELVLAGDLLDGSSRWKQLEQDPKATLATKRAVLADPQVTRALRLLHAGLQKPIGSPREKTTFDTLLPELSEFRALGRLLAVQQYVYCADGRMGEALHNARLGMRLGQVVQTDTLISGLVGVAISSRCIQELGVHLDQLSARDAERLYTICLEWLRQPTPERRMMEAEHRNVLSSLEELRPRGIDHLIDALGLDPKPKPDDDEAIHRSRQLAADLRALAGDAEGVNRLFNDALKRLDEHYPSTLEQFKLPLWQRRHQSVAEDGSLAGRLAAVLVPPFNRVGDAYGRDQATVRLLACHAAILRYRWEHDRAPARLEVLRLGELAVDPFTGQPLEYQPQGRRYRLASVGPEAAPDNPRAVGGRVPLTIGPGD